MPSSVKIQEGEFGREPEPEAVTNKLKLGARECLYFYGGRVVGGWWVYVLREPPGILLTWNLTPVPLRIMSSPSPNPSLKISPIAKKVPGRKALSFKWVWVEFVLSSVNQFSMYLWVLRRCPKSLDRAEIHWYHISQEKPMWWLISVFRPGPLEDRGNLIHVFLKNTLIFCGKRIQIRSFHMIIERGTLRAPAC